VFSPAFFRVVCLFSPESFSNHRNLSEPLPPLAALALLPRCFPSIFFLLPQKVFLLPSPTLCSEVSQFLVKTPYPKFLTISLGFPRLLLMIRHPQPWLFPPPIFSPSIPISQGHGDFFILRIKPNTHASAFSSTHPRCNPPSRSFFSTILPFSLLFPLPTGLLRSLQFPCVHPTHSFTPAFHCAFADVFLGLSHLIKFSFALTCSYCVLKTIIFPPFPLSLTFSPTHSSSIFFIPSRRSVSISFA